MTKSEARRAVLKRAWKKVAGLDEEIRALGIEISFLKKEVPKEGTTRQIASLKQKRETLLLERRAVAKAATLSSPP